MFHKSQGYTGRGSQFGLLLCPKLRTLARSGLRQFIVASVIVALTQSTECEPVEQQQLDAMSWR